MKTKKLLLLMVSVFLSFAMRSQTGTALNFDGANDYVVAPDPNLGSSDFTIETWMKPSALTVGDLASTRTNEFFANGNWWTIQFLNGGLTFETAEAGLPAQMVVATPSNIISLGNWHHIAVVRAGLTYSIIVDDVVQGSGTDTGTRPLTTGNNTM